MPLELILIAIAVVLAWAYMKARRELSRTRQELSKAQQELSNTQQELFILRREMDFRVEQRLAAEEERIRAETRERSRATLKGRIAEQMVPFHEAFRYDPSDARFIGAPIDYIIFDGYTDLKDRGVDRPITIILADVKTGPHTGLSRVQETIKEAAEKGSVRWKTIRLYEEEGAPNA